MKSCPFVFLAVLLLLTSGCVTSSPYKADAAHPIRTVAISRQVKMPDKMLFYGLSESMAGMLGGVVGAMSTIFRHGEDFGLPGTLRADLAAELAKNPKFKIQSSGKAEAEIQIHVKEYGFYQARGFMQRHVKPILTVETQMIRNDGTMVWQSGVVINPNTKGTPEILPEDLKNNHRLALDAINAAARLWAEKTAASLR